jgi:uncharacterized membrane protein YcfT
MGQRAFQAMTQTQPATLNGGTDEGRVPWIDLAKGICIVFVVATHATLGVGDAMGREGFMHYVVAFTRPFRMPEFFLISGLFLSRVIDRDWRSYGDRRIAHFAYFYVLWLLIYSVVKFQQVSGGTLAGFLEHLAFSLVEPFSILWFIYILGVFSVVTKLLRRVPSYLLLGGAALLEILPIETSWYLLNEFCNRYVYFVAGYLLAPHVFRLADWAGAYRWQAFAALALWFPVNAYFTLTPSGIAEFPSLASLPFISLALGMAGTIATVFTAVLLVPTRLCEPLRYAGFQALTIYLAFLLPMAATRIILLKLGIIEDVGVISLIVTIAAFITPLIVERLVRDTPASFLFKRPAAFRLAPKRVQIQPAE